MKKILIILGLICLPLSRAFAEKEIERWNFKGSTTPAVAISSAGVLEVTDGINIQRDIFISPALSRTAVANITISSVILARQGTTYINTDSVITQPGYPVVLTFELYDLVGGSTQTFKSTVTVVGINACGATVNENLSVTRFSSKTVNAYLKVSSITWGTVDTWASTDAVNVYLVVGTTGTFGLSSVISRTDDVYKVRAFGVDSTTYTVSVAYGTVGYTGHMEGLVTNVEVWSRNVKSAPPRKH
jgi:hypothetical protein